VTPVSLFRFYYERKERDKVQATTCRPLNYGVWIRSVLPVRIWLVVSTVTLGQVPLPVLLFSHVSVILPALHTHSSTIEAV
jgi:hypothetical protein